MSEVIEIVRSSLLQTLQIEPDRIGIDPEFRLLGAVPEFDSMAVLAVLTDLEDRLDIEFDDDEISADIFESLGTLTEFVRFKISDQ